MLLSDNAKMEIPNPKLYPHLHREIWDEDRDRFMIMEDFPVSLF
jgi:hypothetical protein